VQAQEIHDLEARIRGAATALRDFDPNTLALIESPEPEPIPLPTGLAGRRIGIARDWAFTFLYRANLGLHSIALAQGELRGHTFHYSRLELPLTPVAWSRGRDADRRGELLYRQRGLHASYLHLYFPSNPQAVVGSFNYAGQTGSGHDG